MNLDDALREKAEWYKEFQSMEVTNSCDAGCGKPATEWFGNTSCATCGDSRCVKIMQKDYDANLRELMNEI